MKEKSIFKDIVYVILGTITISLVFLLGKLQLDFPYVSEIYYTLTAFCLGQWIHLSVRYIQLRKSIEKCEKKEEKQEDDGVNGFIFSHYKKVTLPEERTYKQVPFLLFNAVDGKYYHSPDNPVPFETDEEILEFTQDENFVRLEGIVGSNNLYTEGMTLYMNSEGNIFIGSVNLMNSGLRLIANKCEYLVPSDTFILNENV